jgi:hypothetical protein
VPGINDTLKTKTTTGCPLDGRTFSDLTLPVRLDKLRNRSGMKRER